MREDTHGITARALTLDDLLATKGVSAEKFDGCEPITATGVYQLPLICNKMNPQGSRLVAQFSTQERFLHRYRYGLSADVQVSGLYHCPLAR